MLGASKICSWSWTTYMLMVQSRRNSRYVFVYVCVDVYILCVYQTSFIGGQSDFLARHLTTLVITWFQLLSGLLFCFTPRFRNGSNKYFFDLVKSTSPCGSMHHNSRCRVKIYVVSVFRSLHMHIIAWLRVLFYLKALCICDHCRRVLTDISVPFALPFVQPLSS